MFFQQAGVGAVDGRETRVRRRWEDRARDLKWNRTLQRSLAPVPVEFFIEPAFGYVSEQRDPGSLLPRIRAALAHLGGDDALLWAHNLAIARNLPLARACSECGIRMIAHHHD